jgi:hypothetical protein
MRRSLGKMFWCKMDGQWEERLANENESNDSECFRVRWECKFQTPVILFNILERNALRMNPSLTNA